MTYWGRMLSGFLKKEPAPYTSCSDHFNPNAESHVSNVIGHTTGDEIVT